MSIADLRVHHLAVGMGAMASDPGQLAPSPSRNLFADHSVAPPARQEKARKKKLVNSEMWVDHGAVVILLWA